MYRWYYRSRNFNAISLVCLTSSQIAKKNWSILYLFFKLHLFVKLVKQSFFICLSQIVMILRNIQVKRDVKIENSDEIVHREARIMYFSVICHLRPVQFAPRTSIYYGCISDIDTEPISIPILIYQRYSKFTDISNRDIFMADSTILFKYLALKL